MTKEFKQIEMHVGDFSTFNFKTGFMQAKKLKAEEVRFSWNASKRISDEEFVNRIKKVWAIISGVDIDSVCFEPAVHSVRVTSIHNKPLYEED